MSERRTFVTAAVRALRVLSWWDAALMLACAFALSHALETTEGLLRPYDADHFRDITAARTAADGAPLADPFYVGETIWYNPLVPWLVGAGSLATGIPVEQFHVRGGPWLNLLAPAGMYVLSATLFGRPAALASTTTFLFLSCGTEPSWACATYSPWLFTANFVQGLFYLALTLLLRAEERRTGAAFVAAGALAGVTFLGHTAPIIILAVIVLALLAARVDRRRALGHAVIYGATACIVASPFLWSIAWRYHLRVLNPAPMEWGWVPLTPQGFGALLRQNLGVVALLSVPGVGFVAWQRKRTAMIVVASWAGATLGLVGLWLLRYLRVDWHIPALLPGIHYWFYLKAVLAVLAGVGLWSGVRVICPPRLRAAALIALLVLLVWWHLPAYRAWDDLRLARGIALGRAGVHAEVTRIVRRTSQPTDVFLASRGAALLLVGPAGRKTVAVQSEFSNPYVEWRTRASDRDQMFDALKRGQLDVFRALARRYGVTRVIAVGADECRAVRDGGWRDGHGALFPTFQVNDICLFDVN